MKNFTVPALRLLPLGLLFGLLFGLLPSHFAGAAPAPTKVNGLPVIVNRDSVILKARSSMHGETEAFSGDALTPFIALLKAHPRVRFVSLSWADQNPLAFSGVDILYDRVRHTVTVARSSGFYDNPSFRGGEVRFLSVRESVFAAILSAHPKGFPRQDPETDKIGLAHNEVLVGWDGFQFLYQPRYGCRSRIIRADHSIPKD